MSAGWVGWTQPHLCPPTYSEHGTAWLWQGRTQRVKLTQPCKTFNHLIKKTYLIVGIYLLPVF